MPCDCRSWQAWRTARIASVGATADCGAGCAGAVAVGGDWRLTRQPVDSGTGRRSAVGAGVGDVRRWRSAIGSGAAAAVAATGTAPF